MKMPQFPADRSLPLRAAAWLALAAGFFLYLPTISFEFLWDDTYFIVQNPFLREPEHLWTVFSHFVSKHVLPVPGGARPMWVSSLVWDYSLWGLNPAGFHFTNVLLHAMNCALAVLLAHRILGGARPALAVGVAFAAHPLHVEPVAAVSFRTDLLCLLFLQLACLCYWPKDAGEPQAPRGRSLRRFLPYPASLLFFIAALLSKETAAALPLLLTTGDYLRYPARTALKRLALVLPFVFLVAAFYAHHKGRFDYKLSDAVQSVASLTGETLDHVLLRPAAAWAEEPRPPAAPPPSTEGLVYRAPLVNACTMGNVFARYVVKLVFPLSLSADYTVAIRTSPASPVVAGSLLLFFGGLALFFIGRRRDPALSWGLAWFYIFLIPVSNVVRIVNLMTDRYLYIPSLGFLVFGAALFRQAERRADTWPRYGRTLKRLLWAAALLLLAFWTFQTLLYSQAWRDEVSFYTKTLESSPANFRPWYNAGLAFQRRDRWEKALVYYRQAAERAPRRKEIYVNMGRCYEALGDTDAAETEYRHALRVDPGDAAALLNLGNLQRQRGRLPEAADYYRRAMDAAPRYSLAAAHLAETYRAMNQLDKAAEICGHLLDWEPANGRAYQLLGEIYIAQGDRARAKDLWRLFLKKNPDSPLRNHFDRLIRETHS